LLLQVTRRVQHSDHRSSGSPCRNGHFLVPGVFLVALFMAAIAESGEGFRFTG